MAKKTTQAKSGNRSGAAKSAKSAKFAKAAKLTKASSKAPAKRAAGKPAKPAAEVKKVKLSTKPASKRPRGKANEIRAGAFVEARNNGTPLPDFRSSTSREAEHHEPPTEDQLRKVKTGLSKRDLEHFRQLLLEKRRELLGDLESLQTDTKNNGGNLSHMPVHMADVGSDNYEQEFTLGLVESERKIIREIDEALDRMGRGFYGVCVERGVPISRARLDAKPWAKYCIEVVRERERRGLM